MPEVYPQDAALLALGEDAETGVEYIPTGRSPYYLEFRKLVQRLLLATTRANDLRLYADGGLTIGVKPGRLVIHGVAVNFAGAEEVAVDPEASLKFWIDSAGTLQSAADLPANRADFIPLAEVYAGGSTIDAIFDLRGEAFLNVPDDFAAQTAAQIAFEGPLTASVTGKLIGVVPIGGVVTDVMISVGANIASSNTADGVTATAKVNGTELTTTRPSLTAAAGTGFRSTARGDGAAAAIKSDGTQTVQRGDVLTVDVTRTVAGTLGNDAADVVVTVVIRPQRP